MFLLIAMPCYVYIYHSDLVRRSAQGGGKGSSKRETLRMATRDPRDDHQSVYTRSSCQGVLSQLAPLDHRLPTE
jgi:hypothetical protein